MDAPPPLNIAFTIRAGKDLQNIRKYLTSKASASIARKVLVRLFDAIETLLAYPARTLSTRAIAAATRQLPRHSQSQL